jgi:putative transposase
MPDYRRAMVAGGTFFFTVVTANRRPIFGNPRTVRLLKEAIDQIRRFLPFESVAGVVLPDHLHCIWTLPDNDHDFSLRWKRIKAAFTRAHLSTGGAEARVSVSRREHGERGVWQRRFWEHTVRDEDDLRRHLDYIHYNPVKHGLVTGPMEWPWSSLRRFVSEGFYDKGWGAEQPQTIQGMDCE